MINQEFVLLSVKQLEKLTGIMRNCISRLEEASRQLNSDGNLINQMGMEDRKNEGEFDSKRETLHSLAKKKFIVKSGNADKGTHSFTSKYDIKKVMRQKLMALRPKPPVNAFIAYVQSQKDRFKESNPKHSIAEITSFASREWKDLPMQVKQPFIDDYQRRQREYHVLQQQFIAKYPEFKALSKSNRRRSKKFEKAEEARSDEQMVDLDKVEQISSDSHSSHNEESAQNDASSSQSDKIPQISPLADHVDQKKEEEESDSNSLIVEGEI